MAVLRRNSSSATAVTDNDSKADVQALSLVVQRVSEAKTSVEVVQHALDTVREAFGWAYGSYWTLDPKALVLVFNQESGDVGPEFRQVTRQVTFAKGVGLSGRTWSSRDLVFVPDLGEVQDCVRAPAAQRHGVKSAVCFPLLQGKEVVGTMDFMTTETLNPTPERLTLLRTVGQLVSQSLERVQEMERQAERSKDMTAVNAVLREVTTAPSEETAIRVALDTIRAEFGWEYGSFWAVDTADRVLKFSIESGSAGEEFRQVTRTSTFTEGVGLAGRTWKSRDLVFEPNMGVVTDCVRAPAAQRAGVKAGVCVPILVGHEVIGTMDFFAIREIELTKDRAEALRNTAFLVSSSVERHRASGRVSLAGQELISSINEVERNVLQASNVASDAQKLTEEANEIVARLNTSSVEIGNVVKVITSIAEQTNLLALNATIEAARAGDAGKGFAVVANEVKDLARETAKATEEVDAKVSAIQADANSVVHALTGVRDTVDQINEAQNIISGVLTEQSAVTRSVLEAH